MMYLSKQVHCTWSRGRKMGILYALSLSLSLSLILNQMSLQILVHWYTDKYEWKERGELNVIYSLLATSSNVFLHKLVFLIFIWPFTLKQISGYGFQVSLIFLNFLFPLVWKLVLFAGIVFQKNNKWINFQKKENKLDIFAKTVMQ